MFIYNLTSNKIEKRIFLVFALACNWVSPNACFGEPEASVSNLHIICSDSEYGLLLLIHILYSYTLYSQKNDINSCIFGGL